MVKLTTPDRGPRNTKLTVLIPSSLLEDLRALREATGQSTGDLVNKLLEAEIARRADDLNDGREIMRIKAARQGRATKSDGQSSKDAASPRRPLRRSKAAAEIPAGLTITSEDVNAWAEGIESTDDRRKRKADGEAFLSWIESQGCSITPEAIEGYKAALREKYPNPGTSKAHISRVNGLIKWAANRSRF